jgi:hypothetical protein
VVGHSLGADMAIFISKRFAVERVRCPFFTLDSAVLGLGSSGCGWCGARFSTTFTLEDAIEFHAIAPLEASRRVNNFILLECPLPLTLATVNSVQTLKAVALAGPNSFIGQWSSSGPPPTRGSVLHPAPWVSTPGVTKGNRLFTFGDLHG